MKQFDYEKLTIENIQDLYEKGIITEIVCDADSKKINIQEDDWLKIKETWEKVTEAIKPIAEAIYNLGKIILKNISSIFERKMTKKRFVKLLQSQGIQRNTINEIVKDNTEPYTYFRYYNIVNGGTNDRKRS